MIETLQENVKLVSTEKNWMESTAIVQLKNLAMLSGVREVVGLPDLHAGKTPVGIAVKTKGVFYPHLIGNDIGCGMGLFASGISMKKYKQDRWVSKLNHIRSMDELVTENPYEEESPIHDLGTIGGGNHFAEFQTLDEIFDEASLSEYSLKKGEVYLLVHSGSRGYGQKIFKEYLNYEGLKESSKEARGYLSAQDTALIWAKRNRYLVAQKLFAYLGFSGQTNCILDCFHNFLEERDGEYLHRKGAVSALDSAVIIPGSRGSLTYLVKPTPETVNTLYSLSHGAGRKWARSLCKPRIREKYNSETIRETKLKSRVVCHDTELLFQEAPEAYKNIAKIIKALEESGLIEVIASFRPLLTFKG